MRILLVIYDNQSYISYLPLGAAYLASALRNAGHRVCVYNQDVHHYADEHLTQYLDANRFDVVGLGVIAGYFQYRRLLSVSAAINASRQRPFYVLGGHGPSPDPAYFLRKTQADAVVLGEGEETAVELLDALAARTSLAEVKGLAYTDGSRVVVNPRRPLIADIDRLPWPAYDLFPMQYYRLGRPPHAGNLDFVAPVLSGRGCPFKCTFCYRMDEGFRPRSNGGMVEEIRFLQQNYGITYIDFADDLLMSSVDRTAALCEAFLEAGLGVRWSCNGRLNYARKTLLELMKRAGCAFINYGIESMDDRVLRNMRKSLCAAQIVEGVEATLAAGISPGLNLIFGNLGDNRETLRKGVEFLLKYDDLAQLRTIRPVTPYPGSELYRQAVDSGLLEGCEDFYERKHVNSDLLSVNFTQLSDEEFHGALLEANTLLLQNHYAKRLAATLEAARRLYLRGDASFRGFRPV
jgi:anaerobic magnesium-protoporphyrin IX monomethyl ester cyclase